MADASTWADIVQAAATTGAVVAAGVWAVHRFQFPDTNSPDLNMFVRSITRIDRGRVFLLLEFRNPHRVRVDWDDSAVGTTTVDVEPFPGEDGLIRLPPTDKRQGVLAVDHLRQDRATRTR